jgi:hypothetical protein
MTRTGLRAATAACAAALLALGAAGTAGAAPTPNTTERVTLGPDSAQLDQGGEVLGLSDDGCQALIAEWSGAIAPGDDNESMDVFVRDCETGSLEHVSLDPDGALLPAGVQSAALASDGRYVAFVSYDNRWSAGGFLYVHDRATHTTRRVPVPTPWEPDPLLEHVDIDPTGRYVAVTVYGVLYLVDLQDGSSHGVPDTYGVALIPFSSQLSTDGDIAFMTGERLLPEDTDTNQDAYLYDRSSDTVTLVSKRPSGESTDWGSFVTISGNGRYVAFIGGFADGESGGWLVDRQEGTVRRVDRTQDGAAPDGWVNSVAVSDDCDVAYDTNSSNILSTEDTNPGYHNHDSYVWDCATNETTLVGVGTDGVQGTGMNGNVLFTPNGRHVAFLSDAPDLVPGDTNGAWDGFIRHLPAG